jgi:hypothetical protein
MGVVRVIVAVDEHLGRRSIVNHLAALQHYRALRQWLHRP